MSLGHHKLRVVLHLLALRVLFVVLRNCMSEFMGLIRGAYDGKKGGFLPGGENHSDHCTGGHTGNLSEI